MNAKINKDGELMITRGGKDAKQTCPFTHGVWEDKPWKCGDWCPLFRESENKPLSVLLQCSEAAYFEDVVDERGYNK